MREARIKERTVKGRVYRRREIYMVNTGGLEDKGWREGGQRSGEGWAEEAPMVIGDGENNLHLKRINYTLFMK